eukprot:6173752-Pleurochrysis_carterae.AAC.4
MPTSPCPPRAGTRARRTGAQAAMATAATAATAVPKQRKTNESRACQLDILVSCYTKPSLPPSTSILCWPTGVRGKAKQKFEPCSKKNETTDRSLLNNSARLPTASLHPGAIRLRG